MATLSIGDLVDDLKATIEALKVAALEHKRRVFLAGNGGDYRRVQCVGNNCPFFIRFKQTPQKTWRVVDMEPAHAADCSVGNLKLTPRLLSKHSVFKNVLETSPSALPVDIAKAFNAATGCTITKEAAYKAMCIARKADAENKKRARDDDCASTSSRTVRTKAYQPPTPKALDIDALMIPDVGTVVDALESIHSLVKEVSGAKPLFEHLEERLVAIRSELLRVGRVDSESGHQFVRAIEKLLVVLETYANLNSVDRVPHHSRLKKSLYEIHRMLDGVSSVVALKDVAEDWRRGLEADIQAHVAELERLIDMPEVQDNIQQNVHKTMVLLRHVQGNPEKSSDLAEKLYEAVRQRVGDPVPREHIIDVPQWFVPATDVACHPKPFATGTFGSVHHGACGRRTRVVVKILFEKPLDPSVQRNFQDEMDLWSRMRHPNVVRLFGANHVSSPPYIICEHAANGNLTDYVAKISDSAETRRIVTWRRLYEAALGIKYLHSNNIVHGDLKLNNLLVGSDGSARVADFGLSFVKKHSSLRSAKQHSLSAPAAQRWRAPEISTHHSRPESDIYSFGMCILEALAGKPLHENGDGGIVKDKSERGDALQRPEFMDDAAWALVSEMIKPDPPRRIKMEDVVAKLKALAEREETVERSKHVSMGELEGAIEAIQKIPANDLTSRASGKHSGRDEMCLLGGSPDAVDYSWAPANATDALMRTRLVDNSLSSRHAGIDQVTLQAGPGHPAGTMTPLPAFGTLLEAVTNVVGTDRNEHSPLALAAYHGHMQLGPALLNGGATTKGTDCDGVTTPYYTCSPSRSLPLTRGTTSPPSNAAGWTLEHRHRVKVCVVGESGAGKTSLVRSLVDNRPQRSSQPECLEAGDQATDKALSRLHFVRDNEENQTKISYDVTMWDIADDSAYQAAHHVFFSRRTVFLICVDLAAFTQATHDRKRLEAFVDRAVLHWIRRILNHDANAEIVLIGTKEDLAVEYELARSRFQSELTKVVQRIKEMATVVTRQPVVRCEKMGPPSTLVNTDGNEPPLILANVKSLDSVHNARSTLQEIIIKGKCSVSMPRRYAHALDEISKLREEAKSLTIGDRVKRMFVPFDRLLSQLKIEPNVCQELLETLHDLSDVLWCTGQHSASNTVVLDPLLLMEFVKSVINDKHTGMTLAHADLKTLPLWNKLSAELMKGLKTILHHFHLVYPARKDGVMTWDSDLIVPAYWQKERPASRQFDRTILHAPAATMRADRVRVQWEYHFESDLPSQLFDHVVIASVSPFWALSAGPDWILYEDASKDTACRLMLDPDARSRHPMIRVEAVVAETASDEQVADLWDVFKHVVGAFMRVLGEFPQLSVSSTAVYGSMQGDLKNLLEASDPNEWPRHVVKWMPPFELWKHCRLPASQL